MRRFPRIAWMLVLGLAAAAPLASPPTVLGRGGPEAPVPGAPTLKLDQAVVIGASVSAGFGAVMCFDQTPKDAPAGAEQITKICAVSLADILAAASADPSARPASFATARFALNPDKVATSSVRRVLERRPTIVFAVDFLFWYTYGWANSDEERLPLLERGLARLAELGDSVPIVLGDVPDMRHATIALNGKSVPSKESLAKFNQRIRAWAAQRKNVIMVPLSEVVRKAIVGEPADLAGRRYEVEEVQGWIQGDGLHATPAGLAAIAVDALWRLREAKMLPEGAVWEQDPQAVLGRVRPADDAAGAPPAPVPPADTAR